MKVTILMGSFRPEGNTATFTSTVIDQLESKGAVVDYITLKDKLIEPCTACWTCQDVFNGPGCPKKDDCNDIFQSVMNADCILFATPMYSWYCTPPLKSMMDRLVYTMNKYYGEKPGPCLWEGKKLGIITTCGYDIEHGAGAYELGVKRYAEHSKLQYIGMIGMQDSSDRSVYKSDEAIRLAQSLLSKIV